MAFYESFETEKGKQFKLVFEQNQNINDLENKEIIPTISVPRNTHYKSAKLLFDSDWFVPQLEKFPGNVASSQIKNTLLPEKALYSTNINLNLTEQFLPYLQIEILARTTPTTRIVGVFPFVNTSRRKINIQLFDYLGITFRSIECPAGCQDLLQPANAYSNSGCIGGFRTENFIYPALNFPVPVGIDPSFLLPVLKDFIEPNLSSFTFCGTPSSTGWRQQSQITFNEYVLLQSGTPIQKLETAKEILEIYDNIDYISDLPNFKGNVPTENALPLSGNSISDFYVVDDEAFWRVWKSDLPEGSIDNWVRGDLIEHRAYEVISSEQLVTAKQNKKIIKINDNTFNLDLQGYVLLLSEAIKTTSFSDSITPTYEPNGEDIELKINIYIQNPTSYSELKKY